MLDEAWDDITGNVSRKLISYPRSNIEIATTQVNGVQFLLKSVCQVANGFDILIDNRRSVGACS